MVLRALMAALFVIALPAAAQAEVVDPANCTETVQYDPSIPTFRQVALEKGFANPALGGFGNGTANRHVSAQLYIYEEAIAAATVNNPRVRVIVRDIGPTVGNRKYQYSIISTPENVARVEGDAQFYREVRSGAISRDAALADIRANPRPALGWITETPHGNEPAGGEASMRMLYELAARTDCANMRRLQQMTYFVDPARNPDGRDQNQPTRTTAWGFDPNRDLMYQSQDVNQAPLEEIYKYPGLFFIDAHQQAESYFFPPNEDPVHHEISHFALDEISNVIGPAIQNRFNDQSLQYRNYNEFDLFVPEFGDSVSSLILGSAGMTYEKGSNEGYGKQVYDHYLAIDETLNVVTKEKDKLLEGWISQWQEATEQGAKCELQKNTLVSPLHDTITQQPPEQGICGYYFKPGNHSGDTAHVLDLLQRRDVHVFRLDQPTTVTGAYDWGSGEATNQTLPAGTLWVPTAQTMKHWINATLEENPFIPYPFFFDVVNWSFPDTGSAGGNGQLLAQLPPTAMTEVTGNVRLGLVDAGNKPVLAFSTDSMEALGLLTELLDKGATAFRAAEAFDAAGKHFPTGTALVDATTLAGIDLAALAAARETPVTGLDSFPVARFQVDKPKIAVFTGAANVPSSPLFPAGGSGHCTSTAYCEMLFTLSQRMRIPASMLTPVTSGDIANGVLNNQNFTALVSLNSQLAATGNPSPATGLRNFVNAGGNYIVSGSNGLASMRNAGMTTVNTFSTATWNAHCPNQNDPQANGSLLSPGTAYNAEFNTDNPVAWGFDEGGYIWRESSNPNTDLVLDTPTLAGNGGNIPGASAAVSYPQDLEAYGFECNGLGPDRLPGRPYVVDQPFGAGHSTLVGSNPFFRSWSASTQRLAFNAILYPRGTAIAPAPAAAASASRSKAKLAAKPLSSKQLPKVKSRPARRSAHRPTTDVVLIVKRSKVDVLEGIVRKAKLPAKVAERIRWDDRSDGSVSMTIVGAADFARNWKGDASTKGQDLWIYTDRELRPAWAWRIINGLIKHRLPHQDQI